MLDLLNGQQPERQLRSRFLQVLMFRGFPDTQSASPFSASPSDQRILDASAKATQGGLRSSLRGTSRVAFSVKQMFANLPLPFMSSFIFLSSAVAWNIFRVRSTFSSPPVVPHIFVSSSTSWAVELFLFSWFSPLMTGNICWIVSSSWKYTWVAGKNAFLSLECWCITFSETFFSFTCKCVMTPRSQVPRSFIPWKEPTNFFPNTHFTFRCRGTLKAIFSFFYVVKESNYRFPSPAS